MTAKHIAIFASGSGTNAQNIAEYFRSNPEVSVSLILTNKEDAFVLTRAAQLNIPSLVFKRKEFYESDTILKRLVEYHIDFIILAGFLWLIPVNILKAYPWKIINIHPALLPKYGGKGMYGDKVHKAVYEAGEKRSGISIHFVNEKYDDGKIIFQKSFEIEKGDNPESIASKVHVLEYQHFPRIIEKVILGNIEDQE